MGTADFAVPPLDALVEAGYAPVAVVTGPDKRAGRGRTPRPTPVKRAAERHGLPLLQPASVKRPAFADEIRALKPDVIAVVAFKILPPSVYEAAPHAFNLHASLLPAFRGAAPIQRALMAGAERTGVTTFFLQRTVDTGEIILQRALDVPEDWTAGDLHDALAEIGAEAVVETVRRIEAGDIATTPQDDALASPAPKLFRDDAQVDWTWAAPALHNFVRGQSPVPGAWTVLEGETVKLYRTRVAEGTGAPGTVLQAGERLVVAAGEGALEILEVQREGRRRLAAADALRGWDLEPGARFVRGS